MAEESRRIPRHNVRAIIYDIDPKRNEPRFLLLHNYVKRYWQNIQGGTDGKPEITALKDEAHEEAGQDSLMIEPGTRTIVRYDAKRNGSLTDVLCASYAAKGDMTKELRIGRSEDNHDKGGWFGYDEARRMLTKYPEQLQVFDSVVRKSAVLRPYLQKNKD